MPRTSRGWSRNRASSPRKPASSSSYDWMSVPIAPSITRMRWASSGAKSGARSSRVRKRTSRSAARRVAGDLARESSWCVWRCRPCVCLGSASRSAEAVDGLGGHGSAPIAPGGSTVSAMSLTDRLPGRHRARTLRPLVIGDAWRRRPDRRPVRPRSSSGSPVPALRLAGVWTSVHVDSGAFERS